jgi:hypothetical protein
MRKIPAVVRGVVCGSAVVALVVISAAAQSNESVKSSPPDLTNYFRPALPQDLFPKGRPATRPSNLVPVFPDVLVVEKLSAKCNLRGLEEHRTAPLGLADERLVLYGDVPITNN